MASSNLVQVTYIKETTYGETPVAGNFETARFTSESLSGTPDTVESQQIKTDRMSSGQVVVGLAVEGDLNIELAKEKAIDDFLESAMYSTWNTLALVTVDFDIDATAKTLTRAAGSFVTDGLVVGDIITLAGFTNAENNVQVMVTAVTALVLDIAAPSDIITEVGSGTTYKRSDKLTIGTTKNSFTMVKKFLDLTNKGVNYRGMIASECELNVAFGELINGKFAFQGNDHQTVDAAIDFANNGRTINAPATTNTLNGSVDMPFIASSAIGTFGSADFDVQSVNIKLNNNLTAQNVIGDIAPKDYSAGTAQIEIGMSAYLTNSAWAVLDKKLSQEPFAMGFMVKNAGGYYGFYLPAIQVSFPDPASGGQNQDVLLDMSGTAKVGATGESALTIYRG